MKIIVSRNELLAALLFASDDDTRYVLNGVNIEVAPGHAPNIVATDGKRLVVIKSKAEQEEPFPIETSFTLRSDFVKPMCALSKAMGGKLFPWIAIEARAGSERVSATGVGSDFHLEVEKQALVEGEYPKWRQILPPKRASRAQPGCTDVAINSEYVGAFAKAAKLLESSTPIVQMNLVGKEQQIEVKIAGLDEFYGLVMQCRLDESVDYQPEFLSIIEQIPVPESPKALVPQNQVTDSTKNPRLRSASTASLASKPPSRSSPRRPRSLRPRNQPTTTPQNENLYKEVAEEHHKEAGGPKIFTHPAGGRIEAVLERTSDSEPELFCDSPVWLLSKMVEVIGSTKSKLEGLTSAQARAKKIEAFDRLSWIQGHIRRRQGELMAQQSMKARRA